MTTPSLHPFLSRSRPFAFAHRGGSLEGEENTMPAFDHAVALGYSHVELDVHATTDGVVVIHHDDSLRRMTGDPRAIGALDAATLAAVRTRGGAEIPHLAALLEEHPGLFVNIEAKSDAVVAPLAALIDRMGVLERVCVGSFSPARVAGLRAALGPGLCWSPAHLGAGRLWLAGWGLPVGQLAFPVVQVPTHFRGLPVVTPRFIRAAHARGIKVQVWTVDDRPEMVRLLDMGVDGLMTDRPRLLRQVLLERGQWEGA
ncbi:MAG: glycerophosphodiester phosphodiesterase family protein [Pararhodobacter sp.]